MKVLKSFKLAVLQTKCTINKKDNINFIKQALQKAGQNGANISVLGQICNSPYTKQHMIKNAQQFQNSQTLSTIKQVCQKNKMYAIGSIPRIQNKNGKQVYYNTAFIIDSNGKLAGQMDKVHLFDIDIPGKITYKQSQTFQRGDNIMVFDTQYCKIGVGICYDLRFAQMGLMMAQKGARVLVYPGSFNHTTGPLHWQLLLRGRALDTQCYTVGVSCAQAKQSPQLYQAWGHSTVVDPFGKVLIKCNQDPIIQYCQINPQYTQQVRSMIPVTTQKRNDLYKLVQQK